MPAGRRETGPMLHLVDAEPLHLGEHPYYRGGDAPGRRVADYLGAADLTKGRHVENMVKMPTSTKQFSRHSPFLDSSTHFLIFGELHSEINRIFWAGATSLAHTNEAISASNIQGKPPSAVLRRFVRSDQGFLSSFDSWQETSAETSGWLGLSIITAIASHFEVYLAGVIRCALESDPGCIWGCTRKVDGAQFLKHSNNYDFGAQVKQCVEGTWQKRVSEIKKLFKTVPSQLNSSIGALEKLRELRNGAAHKLGRDMKHEFSLTENSEALKPPSSVTHAEIIKHLDLTRTLAKVIDGYLMANHIGSYEIVRLYHEWHRSPRSRKYANNPDLSFRKYAGERRSLQVGQVYSKSLAEYYAQL